MEVKPNKYIGPIVAFSFFCFILIVSEVTAHFLLPPKNRLERILSILEQDPVFFWKQKPNLNVVFEGTEVRTNRSGLRGDEIKPKKKNGEFRIVCLGASPTFGWGVSEDSTYSHILENLLSTHSNTDRVIEVINAGSIGYSSYQGLRYLKREIIKYNPDVITVSYVLNDVDKHRFYRSNGKSDKELDDKSHLFVTIENILEQSDIYRAIRYGVGAYQSLSTQYFGRSGKSTFNDIRRISEEDYKNNLIEIIKIAKENKIEVVFVKMPVNLPIAEFVSENEKLSADVHMSNAINLASTHNYAEAISELEHVIDKNSHLSKAYYYLGSYHERLGKKELAHNYFQKAIKYEIFECGRLGLIYNEIMQKISQSRSIPLVDIVAKFSTYKEKYNSSLFLDSLNDTIHPNEIGHNIIAQELFKILAEKLSMDRNQLNEVILN